MNTSTNHNARSSSTTLRPRTKRLISGLSENGETELPTTASPIPSPFGSRPVSPIPAAHPQRLNTQHATNRFAGHSWGRRAQLAAQGKPPVESPVSPTSFAGLWDTGWSTLQGLASDFLGNEDVASSNGDVRARQRKPIGRLYTQRSASASGRAREWGPAPTSHPLAAAGDLGSGTRQEREAAVRAQKRKDMLMREESSYADALGKFKRRLSDDHESMSAPPGENDDRAALVYLHHVTKDDTLAGITIKYNVSANMLRKANRMWPNDTVQSRQALVLPVDACGVKGKPVSAPDLFDTSSEAESLSAGQAEEVTPTTAKPPQGLLGPQLNGNAISLTSRSRTTSLSTDHSTSRRTSTSATGDPPWHHDSWVTLPNFPKPTEIARLSRRALGYFPPARRKSNCFSDSTFSTPSVSLDLARDMRSDMQIAPGALRQLEPSPTPRRPSNSSSRPRRTSTATTGYYLPNHLTGPGGVGTMKPNVHSPGPAQDGLNKIFAKHLPDVAPPKHQTDLLHPELPLYSDESGTATPSYPDGRGGSGSGIGLEHVGGAIEGWVRRLASRAQASNSAVSSKRAARASVGTAGRGVGGVGDLIEMTDEFEIGGDEEEEEEEDGLGAAGAAGARGRPVSVVRVGLAGGSSAEYRGGGGGVEARSRSGRKGGKDD